MPHLRKSLLPSDSRLVEPAGSISGRVHPLSCGDTAVSVGEQALGRVRLHDALAAVYCELQEEGQMSTNQIRLVVTTLLFFLIFASGYWLSHSAKPQHAAILTIHKLASLAAIALLGIVVYQTSHVTRLAAIEWTAVVATGALFLSTMATGGLLSASKPMPRAISMLHRITPLLTALSTAVAMYLLLGQS